jgi:adenine-specific DNA-methyltransferase
MAGPGKTIEVNVHTKATRKNIPTAEQQSFVEAEDAAPKAVRYGRNMPLEPGTQRARTSDLDPQLVWRGKDQQDWSDLVVQAPPIYIQEKVHPKAIIEDLRRQTQARQGGKPGEQFSFFDDFNGLPDEEAKLEFYQHDAHWANRMILGDSLQVMASLAEKEGLRGQVQCIYIDPPYGIKFNSNWQVSTRSRDVKDGKTDQISREPEQIKAFRDTWKDGIHSYLTYLRDRLTVARDLLTESGSIFVQIGDENLHRVRAVMEEIFGEDNFISVIAFRTTTGLGDKFLDSSCNYIVWFGMARELLKYREIYKPKTLADDVGGRYRLVQTSLFSRKALSRAERTLPGALEDGFRIYRNDNLTSQSGTEKSGFPVTFRGHVFKPGKGYWKTNQLGMGRLIASERVAMPTVNSIQYVRFLDDFPVAKFGNMWTDTQTGAFTDDKIYVVQTNAKVIERCMLMTTDPGDLVLDPTCGSGTSAYVAEQWGRRWITIDTSRVALALARSRLMGARYPYFFLADTREGVLKEAQVSGKLPVERPTHGDIRQGFVYQRVPHITLKSIANNADIDTIWDKWQQTLEPLRAVLNTALGKSWEDWEIPREAGAAWPAAAQDAHTRWWEARIARQTEIDASIAERAEQEFLYDKPYDDSGRVRVAGPFTVESLSPHRILPADDDDLWEDIGGDAPRRTRAPHAWKEDTDFSQVVLDHLKTSGVHQGDKKDRITFTSLSPWPGEYIAAEGRTMEGETERRAAIFVGPEFGTVARPDLVAAAREAREGGFDLLIACAFNFDAHASELARIGPLHVIRARMNPDLHMADELKNTGAGNLFVVFGEPDVAIERLKEDTLQVRILGLDIFDPQKGEVRAGGTDDIAAWFIDTDYNEESFFVRHAYFLGAQDPYKALKTTLKADIDEEAWQSLTRDVSRPFPRPAGGRIAVKVINHFGDEVMKVFSV